MASMNLFSIAAALAVVPSALGHGYMSVPPARQLPECNDRTITGKYSQGAGTGGGVNGFTMGGEPGLCGDPFVMKDKSAGASTFVDLPCQAERLVYTEGTTLDMTWTLMANHGGFFECKICDDADNLSEACFNKWPLLTVEHNDPRWWIMTAESSRVHDEENKDKPRGHPFQWSWHLPMGLTCEHCVVQCTWPSATHCVFPCEREVCGWYADQYNHIMRPPGASNYEHVTGFCEHGLKPPPDEAPQIFRNCGDITIVPSGTEGPAGGAAPLPEPETDPAVVPAPEPISDIDAEVPADEPAVAEVTPEATTPPVPAPTSEFVEESDPVEDPPAPSPSPSASPVAQAAPSPGGGACGGAGQPVCSGAQLNGREFECDHGFVRGGDICVPWTAEVGTSTTKTNTKTVTAAAPSPGGGACGGAEQPVCSGAQLAGRDYQCDPGYVGEGGICVLRTAEEDAKNQEMMDEEEEYEVANFSPAGNVLSCDDGLVKSVFKIINVRRAHNNSPAVECSERATGTAEAWAEAMCVSGEITDRLNNCQLAGYSDDCSEMVTITSEARPFDSLESDDMKKLRKHDFNSVGVGYADCGDIGEKAWVLLFDSPGSTAPAPA